MKITGKIYNITFFIILLLMLIGIEKPLVVGYDAVARFNFQHFLFSGELPPETEELKQLHLPVIDYKYNTAVPLLSSPLYLIGRLTAGDKTGMARISHLKAWNAHFNHIVLYIFLIWLFGFVKRRFKFSDIQGYISVFIVLMTSMVIPHAASFYSEMLWSASILYALDQLTYAFFPEQNSPYHPVKLLFASACIVWFSTALTPIYIVTVIISFLIFVKNIKSNTSFAQKILQNVFHNGNLYTAVGVFIGLLIYFTENFLERRSILDNGYLKEPFIFSPINYIYLFVSPGKGILVFIPAIIAVIFYKINSDLYKKLPENTRKLISIWYIFFFGLAILYGSWAEWGGAGYWGPRFFLMPSIYSAVILSHLIIHFNLLNTVSKIGILGLGLISISVIWMGIAVRRHYYSDCTLGTPACHLDWAEFPFYIFSKPLQEWHLLISERAILSIFIGAMLIFGLIKCRKNICGKTKKIAK